MKKLLLILSITLMIEPLKTSEAQRSDAIIFIKPASRGEIKKTFPQSDFVPIAENVSRISLREFVRSNRMMYETKMIRVHIRAVRDFTHRYKTETQAKWFVTDGGYAASFYTKGIFTRIAYNKKGRWLYNLLEYTERSLSREIRRSIKQTYYDHEILMIHQYEFEQNKTVYLVKLRDQDSNMTTIKVYDEEIEDVTLRGKN